MMVGDRMLKAAPALLTKLIVKSDPEVFHNVRRGDNPAIQNQFCLSSVHCGLRSMLLGKDLFCCFVFQYIGK